MAHRISTQKLAKLLGIGEKKQFGDIVLDHIMQPEELKEQPELDYTIPNEQLTTTQRVLKAGYNYYTHYENSENITSLPIILLNLGYPEHGQEEKNLLTEQGLAVLMAALHARISYIFAEIQGSEKLAQMLFDINIEINPVNINNNNTHTNSFIQGNSSLNEDIKKEPATKIDWKLLNQTIKSISPNDWDNPLWVIEQLKKDKVLECLKKANDKVWDDEDAVIYLLVRLQNKNLLGTHYLTQMQEHLGEDRTTEILMRPEIVRHILKTVFLFDSHIAKFYCEQAHVSPRYTQLNTNKLSQIIEKPVVNEEQKHKVAKVQQEFNKAWHDEKIIKEHMGRGFLFYNMAPIDVRMNEQNLEVAYDYLKTKRSFVHFFDDFPESFFQDRKKMSQMLVNMVEASGSNELKFMIQNWKDNKEDVLYYMDYVTKKLGLNARNFYRVFWNLDKSLHEDVDVVSAFVSKDEDLYHAYEPRLSDAMKNHPKVMLAYVTCKDSDWEHFDWDRVFNLNENIPEEKEYIKSFLTYKPELLLDTQCPLSWKNNIEYIKLAGTDLGKLDFNDILWNELTNTAEKCISIIKHYDWKLYPCFSQEMRANKEVIQCVFEKIEELPKKNSPSALNIKPGYGIYQSVPEHLWQSTEFCLWALGISPNKVVVEFIPPTKFSQSDFITGLFQKLDNRTIPFELVACLPAEIKNFTEMVDNPIGQLYKLFSNTLIKSRLDSHFDSLEDVSEEEISVSKMKI
jgi:hypothetical protein